MFLHEKIAAQLPEWRERVKKLVKEHGDVVVDQVTIGQVYGGMRDSKVMVTDISYADPAEGIRFRGYSIPEVLSKLPKPEGAEMPYMWAVLPVACGRDPDQGTGMCRRGGMSQA
jgi:citrate synthase